MTLTNTTTGESVQLVFPAEYAEVARGFVWFCRVTSKAYSIPVTARITVVASETV